MGFLIHERELRAKLGVRPKPYFVRVADGLHLGYRKGKTISRWVVRRSRAGNYEMQTLFGVEPDDRLPADGLRVLNFQQVMAKLMNDTSKPLRCSFCGKDHTQVDKLVAGPGVFICDACVGLCQLYMDHPAEQGKLLLEDGKPVFDDGNPVFVPLTEAEQEERRRLLDQP